MQLYNQRRPYCSGLHAASRTDGVCKQSTLILVHDEQQWAASSVCFAGSGFGLSFPVKAATAKVIASAHPATTGGR